MGDEMNWVDLPTLNKECFQANPKPLNKLQRWCRLKFLPAKKFGGEWHVDLDALQDTEKQHVPSVVELVIARMQKVR